MTAKPSVSVVLVNFDGAKHLPTCLDSLAEQDYPGELLRVVVVDNGSTDGSLELLRENYPWVSVLAQGRNLGFAPAVNIGVRSVDSDCVALLNNDMRVDRDWVSQLVESYQPDEGVACVAGLILSWEGDNLDFAEGSMNFYGMGHQLGFARPTDLVHVPDGERLLFACGGAMLVGRHVYLESGGFDDSFFAYFEDVDFGWRLNLLGFDVRLAAGARSYHRHHGTSSRFPEHQRMLLYERNSLRSLIKNYEYENLQRVLGPAALLLAERAVLRGGLDRSPYDIGADRQPTEQVARVALSHLHAVADVLGGLDDVLAKREVIQRARRRRDDELSELLVRPMQPVLNHPSYLAAQRGLVEWFGLDQMFPHSRGTRLAIVTDRQEVQGAPGERARRIAEALRGVAEVTLAVPFPAAVTAIDGVRTVPYRDESVLRRLGETSDVILVEGPALGWVCALAGTPAVLVADLDKCSLSEDVESALASADFFVCASERQRDYWLGMLQARKRLADPVGREPSLRQLIDVVPEAVPEGQLHQGSGLAADVHPAVTRDAHLVVWQGGPPGWFDPVIVVEAFARVAERKAEALLVLIGPEASGPDGGLARQRAGELGLLGRSVVILERVTADEREALLARAELAVATARDLPESRLASWSPIHDYLWAGLPIVATAPDPLSELVQKEGLGTVVGAGDVNALSAAMADLLDDAELRKECAARAATLAEQLTWSSSVGPLRAVLREPWRWRERRERRGQRYPTEDMQALLEERDREILRLQTELDRIGRRLSLLRRTPLYPIFRAALRIWTWLRSLRRNERADPSQFQ